MKITEEVINRFNEKYKLGQTPWSLGSISTHTLKFIKSVKKELSKPKLLDLGCGDGWLSLYFSKQGFSVEGIDSSDVAIRKARKESKKANLHITFKIGNALNFPYLDDSFNVVFDRGLFHHLPKSEWNNYSTGVNNILKKQGYFYLIVFSDRSDFPKREKGKMWHKEKDNTGYWTYNHYFNPKLIDNIFGQHFEIIDQDEDKKPQPGGSIVRYFTFKKKN